MAASSQRISGRGLRRPPSGPYGAPAPRSPRCDTSRLPAIPWHARLLSRRVYVSSLSFQECWPSCDAGFCAPSDFPAPSLREGYAAEKGKGQAGAQNALLERKWQGPAWPSVRGEEKVGENSRETETTAWEAQTKPTDRRSACQQGFLRATPERHYHDRRHEDGHYQPGGRRAVTVVGERPPVASPEGRVLRQTSHEMQSSCPARPPAELKPAAGQSIMRAKTRV